MEKTKKEVNEVKLRMTKYLRIVLLIAIVALVAILADLIATSHSLTPRQTSIFEPHLVPVNRSNLDPEQFSSLVRDRGYYSVVGDLELFYKVKTMLSTVNATLLVLLLATYIDMYRKLKSEFTLGLILFSLILLLYAVTSNPLLQQFFGFWGIGLGPFAMLPDLFTSFALVILLYLTMK